MAELGRRAVVQDPLAADLNTAPARQLGLSGGGNPNQSGGQVSDGKLVAALGGVQEVLQRTLVKQIDEEVTRGKIAFMSGVTEARLIENGNKHTQQGFETLNAVDQANTFYQNELLNIDAIGAETDPKTYQQQLMEKRKAMLANLPPDPAVRKVFVAAFEDLGPKLAGVQVQANNAYNKGEQVKALSFSLASTASTSTSSPRVMPGGSLAVSPSVVASPVTAAEADRDTAIRTMLGEAANQGEVGLGAVAWNLRNRLASGKWGHTLTEVAKSPSQYSAWNDADNGGNSLVSKYGPGTPQYERAGKVFDAVMGGHVVDMTGGRLNYFSKSGMLAAGDADGNPYWRDNMIADGATEVQIGAHTFIGTEVQKLLSAATMLKPAEKATALSSAMATQLDQGSAALWDAVGGVAGLRDLGATDQEVLTAYNARKRFEKEAANKFSMADEQWRNGLVQGIEDGSIQVADAEASIQARYDSGALDDQNAQALMRAAYGQIDAGNDVHDQANPELLNEIAGLYDNMASDPTITLQAASEQAAAIAEKYGVENRAFIDDMVVKMSAIDQTRRASIRTAVSNAATKKLTQDGLKTAVRQSLANGTGLIGLTGNIEVPNPDGTTSEVSPQEWGIDYMRDKMAGGLQWAVQSGAMTGGEAAAKLDQNLYSELARQGIRDDRFGKQLTAAVSGKIVGADGTPSESAVAAYDWYKRMSQNPDVGAAYVASMIADPYTRTLLESASILDSGRGDPREAIAKAYDFLSNPQTDKDAPARMVRDVAFQSTLHTRLEQVIDTATDTDWFTKLFSGPAYTDAQREYARSNTTTAALYVERQAQASYMRFPTASPEAHIQMAMQDLQANMRVVGGNIVIGEAGRNISTDMGIAGLPPTAPTKAVEKWLTENGSTVWPQDYDRLRPAMIPGGPEIGGTTDVYGQHVPGSGLEFGQPFGTHGIPEYTVNYNSTTKLMELRLWSDATHTNVVGNPIHLDVESLGKEYLDSTRVPGTLEQLSNGVVTGMARMGGPRPSDKPEGIPEYSDNPMEQSLYGAQPQ